MADKYRPVAVCEGGPRDRWAYYADDIEASRAAALATGGVFEYRPTKRFDGEGRAVWEYSPTARAPVLPPEPPPPSPPPVIRYSDDLDPIPCQSCGEPVFVVRRSSGTPLTLDAEVICGGLWRFDERGRPVRRSTADVYEERRSGDPAYLGGHPAHECAHDPVDPRVGKD